MSVPVSASVNSLEAPPSAPGRRLETFSLKKVKHVFPTLEDTKHNCKINSCNVGRQESRRHFSVKHQTTTKKTLICFHHGFCNKTLPSSTETTRKSAPFVTLGQSTQLTSLCLENFPSVLNVFLQKSNTPPQKKLDIWENTNTK